MNAVCLYPTIEPDSEILKKCGFESDEYVFKYMQDENEIALVRNGERLSDSPASGNVFLPEEKGLIIEKAVTIKDSACLKGRDGVTCDGAEVGLCMMWTCRKLSLSGCVRPEKKETTPDGELYKFRLKFEKGEVAGDLEIELVMYIVKAAENVMDGEENLMNEEGVTLGEVEDGLYLEFKNEYMDFPVVEGKFDDKPLWWVWFSEEWENPKTTDEFSMENICLYLNHRFDDCPTLEAGPGDIKYFDMLVDILSQVYFLIFRRLDEESLNAARNGAEDLIRNSICDVLHLFIDKCNTYVELDWGSDESLLMTLQTDVRRILEEARR